MLYILRNATKVNFAKRAHTHTLTHITHTDILNGGKLRYRLLDSPCYKTTYHDDNLTEFGRLNNYASVEFRSTFSNRAEHGATAEAAAAA